jgi:hypothetical protein
MNGDHMPIGRHRRKHDPKHAQKIKEGGKKAQKIARETTKEHQEVDVPQAEAELLDALKEVENSHLNKATK